jgi:hypothetical protein
VVHGWSLKTVIWFLRTVEQHRVNKEKDEVVGIQIRVVIEEIEWD